MGTSSTLMETDLFFDKPDAFISNDLIDQVDTKLYYHTFPLQLYPLNGIQSAVGISAIAIETISFPADRDDFPFLVVESLCFNSRGCCFGFVE